MGEKAAFGLFGGAFCDPVFYGTRARGPGVFIKTQKPSNFSKTVGHAKTRNPIKNPGFTPGVYCEPYLIKNPPLGGYQL